MINKIKFCFFCLLSMLFVFPLKNSLAEDKIIAVVNKESITQKDLKDFVNFIRLQYSEQFSGKELEEKVNELKMDLLNKLIDDRLILQEARKNDGKIEIAPKKTISIIPDAGKIKDKINEIKKKYGSDAAFQQALAKQGLVQADLENKIRDHILMSNILEFKVMSRIVVSPEEVTSYYNAHPNEFNTGEIRDLDVINIENKDQADSLVYNLRRGEKLTSLATRYPLVVNNLKVSKDEELKKEISDIVYKLNVGEVSDPVEIDGQCFVFRLSSISAPEQVSLSQVQDKIQNFLYEKKKEEQLKKWLAEIKNNSYIKIMQ
ncbi:MAG: peptidyl-prolyl cis-trans isomerase [Candidatus Omnitrophica bacterium]|nr:peptidyl-prolyl cis-trans isomerase [Candidatus Omnitrophota bacterium]